ncbi:MAG TPA: M20/M25/M40 family metallo-hydrolase [Gemmatimonadales bacterium]|nr:M20/M25/M40 family metallo-hydrolase [Gemmatimonadales bacterium]
MQLLLTVLLSISGSSGRLAALPPQPGDTTLRSRIAAWRSARESAIVGELSDLLRIPNLASDSINIRRNAALLVRMLERRGVTARQLETPGSPPAVYGELAVPGATRTVVFYAHYDGQPVDTARWASPPWQVTLRDGPLTAPGGSRVIPMPQAGQRFDPEWRIYARSASDDKAPIVAMLTALDALREFGIRPSVNLKFFFEGEEEAGSGHLREMLTRHAGLLKADLWLFGDGPVHQSRKPVVSFGVRGVMGIHLTVYGPSRPLHSGHYGNWAPNPNLMLAHLLASLRDQEGQILIERFYEDVQPFTAAQAAALAAIPRMDELLAGELRLGRTEGKGAALVEQISRPGLNVSGISGGRTGSTAANVIVPEASAYLDFRLVPDQRPERIRRLLEAHLAARGYHVVRQDPDSATRRNYPRIVKVTGDGGYPATSTALDLPVSRAVVRAAERALGEAVIVEPPFGGSLPLYHFQEVLGAPLIMVPIVNHDNNQHAENENLRIRNLWDGIELYAGLLAWLGPEWSTAERPVP